MLQNMQLLYYSRLKILILLPATIFFLSAFLLAAEDLSAQDQAAGPEIGSPLDTKDLFPPSEKQNAPTPSTPSPVSSASSKAAIESPDDKPKRNISILELEEYIASQRFSKKSGIEERAVLVRTYERISLALCFPPLAFLVNDLPLDPDPRCQETLEKLRKIHANNTILICAEKGVDSLDCVRSFENQTVRKYRQGEIEKLNLVDKQRDPLSSQEVNARFTILQKKLLENIKNFQEGKNLGNLKALEASLFPVLSIICSNDGLELTLEQATANSRSNGSRSGNATSLLDSIRSLEQGFSGPTPTPTQTTSLAESGPKDIYFRTRILSDKCFDTITDAVGIDARLTSPVCFRDGFISPSCLSSLRRFQKIQELSGAATPSANTIKSPKKDGLASF